MPADQPLELVGDLGVVFGETDCGLAHGSWQGGDAVQRETFGALRAGEQLGGRRVADGNGNRRRRRVSGLVRAGLQGD